MIESEYLATKNSLNNVLTYDPAQVDDIHHILEKLEFAHHIAVALKDALKGGDRPEADRIIGLRFRPGTRRRDVCK